VPVLTRGKKKETFYKLKTGDVFVVNGGWRPVAEVPVAALGKKEGTFCSWKTGVMFFVNGEF